MYPYAQFSSVQLLSRVRLFATPWIAARQASLSITNSQSSLILMSIESVMPSRHLILGRPRLLLPPSPPSIKVFSNESTLRMRWPKYWSFSFSIWCKAPKYITLISSHVIHGPHTENHCPKTLCYWKKIIYGILTNIVNHLINAIGWIFKSLCNFQIHLFKPNPQWNGIWRWGLWEVIKSLED